jgi:hypothetical protein
VTPALRAISATPAPSNPRSAKTSAAAAIRRSSSIFFGIFPSKLYNNDYYHNRQVPTVAKNIMVKNFS